MVTRIRLGAILVSFLVAFGPSFWARAQQPEAPAPKQRTDIFGDPLPPDAVARLGTVRFNPGNMVDGLAFSPDGTRLAIWAHDWLGSSQSRLIFSEVASGRELRSVGLPPCNLLAMRWLADGRGLTFMKLNAGEYFIWEFTDEKAALPTVANPVLNSTRQGDPLGAAISPDGRWLATGRMSFDGSAKSIELWEIKSNTPLSQLRPRELGQQDGHGQFLLFSDDAKLLFALSRKEGLQPPGPGPRPPAKMAEQAQLVVYESATGKRISDFNVAPPLAYVNGILPAPCRMVLSPDGKTLYIGSEEGKIHAYDWAARKEIYSFMAHPGADSKLSRRPGVATLAISADGRTLFSSGNRSEMTFWDSQTGKAIARLPEPLSAVGCSALSADGLRLAVADPFIFSTLRILDTATGEQLSPNFGHAGFINTCTVLHDGTAITVSAGDQTIRKWHLESGREIKEGRVKIPPSSLQPLGLTADGHGLFGYDDDRNTVYWDIGSGKKTIIADGPGSTVCAASGSRLLVQTKEDKLAFWDAKAGFSKPSNEAPLAGQNLKGPMRAAISPDGRRLAYVTTAWTKLGQGGFFNRGLIALYDVSDGQLLRRWQSGDARWEHVAFSTSGNYFLVSGLPMRSTVRDVAPDANEPVLPISAKSGLILFDGFTGEPIRSIDPGVRSPDGNCRIDTVAFSASDFMFAAAQYDGSICLYELATGSIMLTFRGHRNTVTQLAFTTDGRRLVTISRDNTGLVWDTSFASLAKPQAIATPAERDKAWESLAKPEWVLAGPAMAALAAEPKLLVAMVRDKLPAAGSPDLDTEAAKKLAAQLGDQVFAVRERASAALGRLGREALPLLQDELAHSTNAEQRRRLQAVIGAVAQSPVPSQQLRQTRVLAALEQIRTDDARAELKRLAEGHPEAALTRDAKAALAR